MKPLCIDLFCGYGGWARGFLDAGYRVIGFDNEPKCAKRYPGEFVLGDVRNLDGARFHGAKVIVASPPCTEFSNVTEIAVARGQRGPREPFGEMGMGLVHEASRIIYEAEPDWWCIENVVGAQRYLGPLIVKNGAQRLWGYFPGFIASPTKKWWSHRRPSKWTGRKDYAQARAIIPYPLARALAEACL